MKHMGTKPRTAVDSRLAVMHDHRGQNRSPVSKSISRGPSQSAPVLLGLGLCHRACENRIPGPCVQSFQFRKSGKGEKSAFLANVRVT